MWWHVDDEGNANKWRSVAWKVQRSVYAGFAQDAVPALSAWIYSQVRMRLWELICQAGRDNVYYVDTDSLIVNYMGWVRLGCPGYTSAPQLGQLTLRGEYQYCNISGIKYYACDGQVVCSGRPKGKHRDAGDGKHYWYEPGPEDYWRRKQRPEAYSVLRRYERLPDYRHGNVHHDGSISPIVKEEW
jgi:hypothetical protein